MGKPTIAFEWQELREDQELPPLSTPPRQVGTANHGRNMHQLAVVGGALCLLTIALLAAIWVERRAALSLAEIENELERVVDAEVEQAGDEQSRAVAAIDNPTRPASLLHDFSGMAASHEKVLFVEVQALRQDAAAVFVVTEAHLGDHTTGDDALPAYRQLRFYRRTEDGWQPTEPVPDLWGQPQLLATAHFDFTYRSRDAQSVQAFAADLDALYARIRHNIDLPPVPDAKITIEVVMESVSNRRIAPGERAVITVVPSPVLLRAPESLSHADILRQSVLLDLVDKAVSEAISTNEVPPRWHSLISAMRLWQTWDLNGPLATSREPVLRWLFSELQAIDGDATPTLPAAYAELCALYSVWEMVPVQGGIPLFCSELDRAALYVTLASARRSTQLRNFIRLPSYRSYRSSYDSYGEQIYMQDRLEPLVTASLLDYIAAAYGREQIGALWPILHEDQDWETLIPAVFGITPDEFEDGWRAYLAGQYE